MSNRSEIGKLEKVVSSAHLFESQERQTIRELDSMRIKDLQPEHWRAVKTLYWMLQQIKSGTHQNFRPQLKN